MKNIKKLMIISLGVLCPVLGMAQDVIDNALTFSNTSSWGTARSRGLGGVGYSFGGDISTINLNPAGLGFYNRSDFSITPAVDFLDTDANYLNNSSNANLSRFNIGNIGVAINSADLGNGWYSGTFGFSVDRINNFSRDIAYSGLNPEDSFVEYAYFGALDGEDSYLIDLAFDTFILETVTNSNGDQVDTTYIAPPTEEFPVQQSEYIERRGGQYRYSLAYGANYEDKLYVGLSVGFHSIDYEQLRTYSEIHTETELDQLTLTEYLDIRGSGVDFSAGIIYRPIESLTIGVRGKTPTWYTIEENFETTLIADFLFPTQESFDQTYLFNPYEYNLRTPAEIGGGVTYFFGNYGFLSVDADYKNYSSINLSGAGADPFRFENEEIDLIAQNALNIRAGGEVRLDPFRIRLGYAHYGDPTEGVDDLDRSRTEFSGGVGFRAETFYVDFALTQTNYNSAITPYPLPETLSNNFATFENKRLTASITAGFTF
ncbi:OmpP1/FadL family transporter [Roseivirga sp. BDSF3-8]|uniref:OmpP1/FadL family transporter n=1 Tax=Roseivirga sp. BDSF3-8 TaxID=3241598 RepID=UPI0035324308